VEELVALAKTIGLPEKETRSVLKLRTLKEAVDNDWLRSRALGITAVPTFMVNHRMVVGFQPDAVLEQFLNTCSVKKRNQSVIEPLHR
jgi:predicted DsbA family dithiol-disulfide isomerase